MYVIIIPEVEQQTQTEEAELLPDVFGPFETIYEAMGQAIDLIRQRYDDEPEFSFYGFGEHYENYKMLVRDKAETYLGATINKVG